jgi:hypothetical protein
LNEGQKGDRERNSGKEAVEGSKDSSEGGIDWVVLARHIPGVEMGSCHF